jgi:hypothetical protein
VQSIFSMSAAYLSYCGRISFTVKEKKSYFGQTSVQYLGFILDTAWVRPDQSRVQISTQWPTPSNAHDLKSFMGDINFYMKFVSHFSQLAHPLHQLSNHAKFNWNAEVAHHFAKLKTTLCSTPVLCLSNMTRPFEIETDASQFMMQKTQKFSIHLLPNVFEKLCMIFQLKNVI